MTASIDFSSLFKKLPEQYVIFDMSEPGFKMIAASDRYLKVTGKKRKEVINNGLFVIFPDTSDKAVKTGKGDLQDMLEKVAETLKPDTTGIIRYDLADEKGELQVRYWQATHYPLIEHGKCIAILQSTADVTEIVHSNEELQLANFKLEEAMNAGLIGSWSWNIQEDIVKGDKGLADLFGVSETDVYQGLPIEAFINAIYEEDRQMVFEHIEKSIKEGSSFECEYRTIDSLSKIRWVIARGRIEKDEKGEPYLFPGVMIDITSRKEAEAALKDSEERLRFMADTMPQLIWITRPDGFHEYYNRPWYEYTGTNPGETDGEGWNNLFHKDDQARSREVWLRSLKTGEPYEIKYRLYNAPTKKYRWVIGRARPFKDTSGKILKWYGTCTDIDDSIKEIEKRKKLEKELKEEKARLESRVAERTSQLKLTNEGLRDEIKKRQKIEKKLRGYSDELKRSNKELEEFAYVSSHDLQEPLRKIQSFSNLLTEEYGGNLGGGDEYLSRIQNSASRMSTLIEDLLVFSRVTTKPIDKKKVDLNITLQDVVNDLDDRIRREKGKVIVRANLPMVYADETHMRQLFQNLLSNALKFHPPNTTPIVKVHSKITEDHYMIYVVDNGIGIDEKYKEKIFAVFQRLNVKQAFDGTGIGLAVCKKIVERYNGTINVESQLGTGTTFIISLPIEAEV